MEAPDRLPNYTAGLDGEPRRPHPQDAETADP